MILTRRSIFIIGLVALAASLGWVGVAQAHALLLRSVPAANAEMSQPPPAIEMWFTESLEPSFSTARLLDSTGAEVETGAVVVDSGDPIHMTLPVGQLGPGIYTVAWQTLSQVDGHEWFGSFPFTVLNPDGTRPTGTPGSVASGGRNELPTPPEVVFRWLTLLGAMLFFGAPLFRLLAGTETSRTRPVGETALAAGVSALVADVIWIAAALLLAGNWGQVVVQALRLGGWGELPNVLLNTRTGNLALARQIPMMAALWVALILPLPFWLRASDRRLRLMTEIVIAALGLLFAVLAWAALPENWLMVVSVMVVVVAGFALTRTSRPWLALCVLAAGALAGNTATSHAAAVSGRGWATLGDYTHLLAAGAWIGGLVILPVLLWRERAKTETARRQALWKLVRRYSYLASFSVFLLAITGLFNSLVQLPDLASLWNTTYGRVLLVKLAVLGIALAIAFLNNRLLHGRRERQVAEAQVKALQRQVTVESAVAFGLMLTVAVLVQTPAPRFLVPATAFQPQLPFTTLVNADDLYVHAQVTPNQVGQNRFWLHLYHESGTSIGDVQLVQLRFNYRDAQLGQASVDLEPLGQSTFAVEGAYLSQAGNWDISIYVRRRGLDDTLGQFSVNVPMGQTANASPWVNPVPTVPGLILAAGILAALGLAPLVWRTPLESTGSRIHSTAIIAGMVLLASALGLSLAGAPMWRNQLAAQQAALRTNPIPASPESLAQGQALYSENCAPCHGPQGRGDGPLGLTLPIHPANLQVHMVPGVHSDAQIFDWITNGYPNSPMPAFSKIFTEEQRWHVLNYIRTLTPSE